MESYSFEEHFLELKSRLFKVFFAFLVSFGICYYFSEDIYNLFLQPLINLSKGNLRKVIYTGLTEAFFTYLKVSVFSAFIIVMPIFAVQTYLFIRPGLYKKERKIAAFIILMSPILFWIGTIFVFYFVMPRAWDFFLSFENKNNVLPIILEARISEYLSLIIQLLVAFGVAFQLPIFMLILNLLHVVKVESFRKQRRLAVVINFIVAGILTPPDVISQIALALPLLLLYETSIVMCKFIEKKEGG